MTKWQMLHCKHLFIPFSTTVHVFALGLSPCTALPSAAFPPASVVLSQKKTSNRMQQYELT